MKFEKEQLLLYAVTNRVHAVKETLYSQVRDALEGGVTCVQLREKYMKEEDFTAEAVKLKALCKNYSVPLIINDNLNVALRSGADGIHVGQEDMSAEEIRKLAGREFIIGVTAKTVKQAKMAEAAGADYIGVGAVFPSPTKQGAIRITRQELKDICEAVSIPSVAIGGVNIENMKQLKGMGMDGFAVVSALFAAEDIQSAARSLISEARAVVY
ncbi:thiamine phosphate synthase [Mogibacterium sp. NSJ-24]|uniref:Thiamine-phosphate synthase n=1 Tax=Lentihominibacter hominis TaxID=2763645 RepID=A0A926E9G9_9FIRM|nr:thiamine phosphate synthase [Lentihominibacter hominis]